MSNKPIVASSLKSLDPDFGIDGKINLYDTIGEENFFGASIKLAKGGYLCAGDLYRYKQGDIGGTWIVKLRENGKVDNTFGVNGLLKFTLKPQAKDGFYVLMGLCQTENHIVFLSYIYTWGSAYDETSLAMFRCSKEGVLDLNFGDRGVHLIPVPADTRAASKTKADYAGDFVRKSQKGKSQKEWAVRTSNPVIYENNKITVCFENLAALRFSEDGLLDTSFNETGILAFNSEKNEVYIAPASTKGKLLVAVQDQIKRYTAAGDRDRAFGIDGVYTVPHGGLFVAMSVDDSGNIVYLSIVLGAPGRNYIGQLLSNGVPDPAFNNGSPHELPYYDGNAYAWGGDLVLTEPGTRYVGVQQFVNNLEWVSYFIRYDQFGTVDTSFGDHGFAVAMTNLAKFYVREPRKLVVFTQGEDVPGQNSAQAYGVM